MKAKFVLASVWVLSSTGYSASVTYLGELQPLLKAHCGQCHSAGSLHYAFADSYAETQLPSKRCPNETVGECIGHAAHHQRPEGTRCRTYVVRPFHREGWVCLADDQRALIETWVADGMVEQ